jgi:hypothetical protein
MVNETLPKFFEGDICVPKGMGGHFFLANGVEKLPPQGPESIYPVCPAGVWGTVPAAVTAERTTAHILLVVLMCV